MEAPDVVCNVKIYEDSKSYLSSDTLDDLMDVVVLFNIFPADPVGTC